MERHRNLSKIFIKLSAFIATLGFCVFENQHLVVSEYEFNNRNISKELDGYKLVQISDFHNARFGKGNGRFLSKVKATQPDIIVITGDFVDSNHPNVNISLALANELVRIAPVYFVTGNHEYGLGDEKCEKLLSDLEDEGVNVLCSESVILEKDKGGFELIGLDERDLRDDTLGKLCANSNMDMATIVLAHEPQNLDRYAKAGPDLVLTGHAHGGQFRIPFFGGLVAPDQGFFPLYSEGRHQMFNTEMIVSRGIGNSIIPIRFLNDPEIVSVVLRSEKY